METMAMIGMLGICSVEDLWKKQISLVVIGIFAALGIGCQLYHRQMELQNILGGMGVGLALLLLSFLSREKIGTGDGALMVSTGIYLGFWENLCLLWMASVMAAVIAIFLYVVQRKGKDYEIPFAPFLLGSYVMLLMMR